MPPRRVLVVAGESAVRESLRRALTLEGYAVELAADGEEALWRMEGGTDAPDLVIVGGRGLADRLRARGVAVPILSLAPGEPAAIEELLALVRALLARR